MTQGGKMKKTVMSLLVIAVLSALLLSACGGTPAGPTAAPAPKGDPAKGATKFAGTCAGCHGPDAKGLTGLGKDLTTSTFAKGLSDADLVAFVTKGRDTSDPANTTGVAMPPKGGNPALTEADLYDIVAYIRTLQK
jgi:mono/diheme cytochrome c family protein